MKTLVLGDIHGRTIWKEIVNRQECDRVIFLGDYFDSKEAITGEQQMNNFLDIIEFKEKGGKEVIMLIGNHDFHYLEDGMEYIGYQYGAASSISYLVRDHRKNLRVAYSQDRLLFTHAGVTETFLELHDYEGDKSLKSVESFLNDLWVYKPLSFAFIMGGDRGGNNVYQPPLWVRPQALVSNSKFLFAQVVGHTTYSEILYYQNGDQRYLFIDTLGTSKQYLSITDGEINIENDKSITNTILPDAV